MYIYNSKNGWLWDERYFNYRYNRHGTVIAVDFDGVITNPDELKTREFQKLGITVFPEETSREYCIKIKKIPAEIYESVTFKVNINNLLSVPLENNVKEVMNNILAKGNMIFIVTSRRNEEMYSLFLYLEKNDLKCNGIFNTCRNSKLDTLENINPDIYIDDTPEKLYKLLYVNKANVLPEISNCKLLLYRSASNKYVKHIPPSIKEITKGWEEIYKMIVMENILNS